MPRRTNGTGMPTKARTSRKPEQPEDAPKPEQPEDAPKPEQPEDAPKPEQDARKDAARKAFEKRQNEKRRAIATAPLSSDQKETARILLSRESADDRAPIVNLGVRPNDDKIYGMTALLRKGDKHAQDSAPFALTHKPRWLSDADWRKACRQFDRLYESDGPTAFERDGDGRLIMPLPFTAGRYAACVTSGDVVNVLRYSGAARPSQDGRAFFTLAPMDNVAPSIAAVYRAGARFNAASALLAKRQTAVDTASAKNQRSRESARDEARITRNSAREAFVAAYTAALEKAEYLDGRAQKAAADSLMQYVAADKAADVAADDSAPIV